MGVSKPALSKASFTRCAAGEMFADNRCDDWGMFWTVDVRMDIVTYLLVLPLLRRLPTK
ncbi:MAG: hypothetical protein AAFZ92_08980 [Pseudomonadota bacterium]